MANASSMRVRILSPRSENNCVGGPRALLSLHTLTHLAMQKLISLQLFLYSRRMSWQINIPQTCTVSVNAK